MTAQFNVSEKTALNLRYADEHNGRLTFGEFLRANEMTGEEITEIAKSLREHGRYTGGGGAAPEYVLEIAET